MEAQTVEHIFYAVVFISGLYLIGIGSIIKVQEFVALLFFKALPIVLGILCWFAVLFWMGFFVMPK